LSHGDYGSSTGNDLAGSLPKRYHLAQSGSPSQPSYLSHAGNGRCLSANTVVRSSALADALITRRALAPVCALRVGVVRAPNTVAVGSADRPDHQGWRVRLALRQPYGVRVSVSLALTSSAVRAFLTPETRRGHLGAPEDLLTLPHRSPHCGTVMPLGPPCPCAAGRIGFPFSASPLSRAMSARTFLASAFTLRDACDSS